MGFLTKLLQHLTPPVYVEYLFNNPHTAIAFLGADFNFIKVNELYAKLNGCKPKDYEGKNYLKLYPSKETELIFRTVVSSGESHHTIGTPFQELLHSGQPVSYWDWSLVPITNKYGKVKYLILYLLDVTKHIKTFSKLEERFYQTFRLSPVAMTIRDLATGHFLNVNDAWTKNTEFTYEEVHGKTPQEINLHIDRDPHKLISLYGHSLSNIDVTYRTKSGQLREALYSADLIEINDTSCILAVLVDLTQRKVIDKEMSRLDRLNLIGQMAAGIGHEIRNPLTTIRGFLQLLILKEKHIEDQEYFKLMISEVDRANSIITEFLSLSKTHSENLSISNLNYIIGEISPLLQAQALEMDRQIKYLPSEITDTIVSEKEIRQLILNMVTNGLDASPPGGTVYIQTQQENDYILLQIKDQGCGIDPSIIHRLGTPFLTTKPQGTGLGLAICYNIVERHSGNIEVDSGLSGTTFNIRFPINARKHGT